MYMWYYFEFISYYPSNWHSELVHLLYDRGL